ncbi:MAG: tRNA1(Val) (adenine(37)-N6)-methyltransferase [Lachnospiraceae bacterium]
MKDVVIHSYERVDELQRNGYRIIQNPDWFCFGIDAVLLSAFARAGRGEKVLDMGTGTGVIPILMSAKYPAGSYTGLEIQEPVAEMASRSVSLNDLETRIRIVQGDIKEASAIFGRGCFDTVTCNPPYMDAGNGLVNPDSARAIARHELLCNFEDIAREAAACLRSGGRFYMIHRPRRLIDLIVTMRAYRLEPKRIRFVHPYADQEANMVLIEARKDGGVLLKTDPPLIVYQDKGIYTREVAAIYEE